MLLGGGRALLGVERLHVRRMQPAEHEHHMPIVPLELRNLLPQPPILSARVIQIRLHAFCDAKPHLHVDRHRPRRHW